jgi:hypothetical protein
MRSLITLSLVFLVLVEILSAFLFGLYKYPSPRDTQLVDLLGLVYGFWSALSWGLSVISNPFWSGWFNFFAASFAALSLGYLSPLGIVEFIKVIADRM